MYTNRLIFMLPLTVVLTSILLIGLTAFSAEAAPQTNATRCRASTAEVTNGNDDGPGSLRFEIAVVQQCLGGDGTITFAPEMDGQTITLTSAIEITEQITVSAETPTTTRVNEHIEYTHPGGVKGILTRLFFGKPGLVGLFIYRKMITRWSLRGAA